MKLWRAFSLLVVLAAAGCSNNSGGTTTPTACGYSLAAATQAAPAGGGSFAVTVTKASGSCTWTASSDASWITFNGASTGTDTGTLTYVAAPNPGTAPRTGTITVQWTGGSAQVVVTQAGTPAPLPPTPVQCTFNVTPSTQALPVEGGAIAVTVTTNSAGCSWIASVDAPWITLTSGTSGSSTGTIAGTATPNPDATIRTGTIIVQWATGSMSVTVTQAVTTCFYSPSPSRQSVPPGGGTRLTFTANRNTPNGCSWTAGTSTPWITLTGATTGTSPGVIEYSVSANPDMVARTGTITLGWQGGSVEFFVEQAAAPAPMFNVSFALFDPGRQTAPATTECQIRSASTVPTTCTLVATASLPTAIVTYDWLVQYPYGFQRILPQVGPSATMSFQESCGQFSASDGGTTEALSVQLTVTDAVGNTATVRSNAGNQPALSIRFFTCGH